MLADDPDPVHLATLPNEMSDNVFEEAAAACASPRSGLTPGIVLTLDADDNNSDTQQLAPQVVTTPGRHDSRSQTRRSTRRKMQAQHRSPSGSRTSQARKDPVYLKDPSGVSRSQSMRTARRPQSVDPTHRFRHRIASIPNDMTLPSDGLGGQRLASNQSLPLPGDEADFMRLRNFAITNKGLVNRGDSFRSKSRSAHSVASMGGSGQLPLSAGLPKDDSAIDYPSASAGASYSQGDVASALVVETTALAAGASTPITIPRNTRYKVLVLGAPDVGKTALTNQFMTSEYKCAYDISQEILTTLS
ncbi:hypothetical protein JTE90_015153 [Oedothorax gibbosus]|uniref:Uncharacterized protein n=1 Tax=Oedothorax gibbosus TaxID=931172 RepID=A0AAV6VQP3_9ARAC|nr:hypothetical protein JTE90_015153 [Oedothorax gibbosus]